MLKLGKSQASSGTRANESENQNETVETCNLKMNQRTLTLHKKSDYQILCVT